MRSNRRQILGIGALVFSLLSTSYIQVTPAQAADFTAAAVVQLATPDAPKVSKVADDPNALAVLFPAVANASTYTVKVYQDGTLIQTIADFGSGDRVTGLAAATIYSVSVTANANGTNYTASNESQKIAAKTGASGLSVTTPDDLSVGARLGAEFNLNLEAKGGDDRYTFSVFSGSLAPGLSLGSATGVISGTPTVRGDFPVVIQVQDSGNLTAKTAAFTIKVRNNSDHTITLQGTQGTYGVIAGAVAGTVVGSVSALDVISKSTITYSLEAGSDLGYSVNPSTGVITADSIVNDSVGSVKKIVVGATNGFNPKEVATYRIAVLAKAGIKKEKWAGRTTFPTSSTTGAVISDAAQLYVPNGSENGFAGRYTGFITVPKSGFYTFYDSSDDASAFYLSPNASTSQLPTGATTSIPQWNSSAFRWDQMDSQKSAPIYMVAGQLYAFKMLYVASAGGANYMGLAWRLKGDPELTNGAVTALVPASAFIYPGEITDTVVPTIPKNFLIAGTTATSVTLNWFPASDDVAVDHYVLSRDGNPIASNISPVTGMATYTDLDPSIYSGTHTYSLVAVDAAGNESSAATIPSFNAGAAWTPIEAAMQSGNASAINNPEDLMRLVLEEINKSTSGGSGAIDAFYSAGPFNVSPYYDDGRMNSASGGATRIFPLIQADATGASVGVAGKSNKGTPVAAFGFSDPFGAGNNMSANLTALAKWMLTGSATGVTTGKKAVVLQRYSNGFATWLVNSGIVASASDVTVCTTAVTDTCLSALRSADLVIAGSLLATDAKKTTEVFDAIKAADSAGHPIIYFDDSREFDSQPLGAAIGGELGWARTLVYWDTNHSAVQVTAANLDARKAAVIAATSQKLNTLKTAITHMLNNDWNVDLSKCPGVYDDCIDTAAAAYLKTEFYDGVTSFLKADLDSSAARGYRIFNTPVNQDRLYKAAILLGDVLRRQIVYPVSSSQLGLFFRALYADNTVYVARDFAEAQPDLGTFSPTDVSKAPRIEKTVEYTARQGSFMASATVYGVPGEVVTVHRNDTNANLTVEVTYTTLRSGSTHVYDGYGRPKYIQTVWTPITVGGDIRIISPYGGAMAVRISGTDVLPEPKVSLTFSGGVVQHPVWDGDSTTAQFESILKTGYFNWVEILTPGFQIHSTVDKLAMSLSVDSFNDYNKLAKSAYYDFYLRNYNEAGFVGPGLSRSSTVTALCGAIDLDCESRAINGIPSMNHMNADQAYCGFGCSGNPYDAFWGFNALGWGDSHEMGHNIQSLHVANKAGAKVTGEVSNNIFPVHTVYSWNKIHPEDNYQVSHSFDQQAMLAAFLNAQNAADPKQAMYEAGYGSVAGSNSNTYTFVVNGQTVTRSYDYNSLEVNFYAQLAALAASEYTPRSPSTPFGDGGWEIITLLHQFTRNYNYNRGTAARWNDWKNSHGFGDYTNTDAVGFNELLLISTSQVLGLDMRKYFDMWGIYYDAKSAAQVAKYNYPDAPKRFWYYEVEGQADEGHRPLVGITDPIGSVEIKSYGAGNIPDLATLLPNVSQLRLFVAGSNTSTVMLKRATKLKAETAGLGTLTFKENGKVIPGCDRLPITKSVFDQWRYGQNYEASCLWSPQSRGTTQVTATFVSSDPKLIAPAPEVRDFTVEAAGAPDVTSLSVSSAAEGQLVTVTGTNLDYLNGVTINGVRAKMFPIGPTSAFVMVPTITDPAKADGKFIFTSPAGHAITSDSFHIIKRVSAVTLPASSVTLSPGRTVKYAATVTPAWADNPSLTWTSSSPAVASVDASGRIIAKSSGTTEVRATSNDNQLFASVSVTVTTEDTYGSRGVNITTTESNIAKGSTLALGNTVYPVSSSPTLTWSSSNTSVATVSSSGVVTGVNYGVATITVVTSDGGIGDTKQVVVVPELTWDDTADTIGAVPASAVNGWWANIEGSMSSSNTWTYRAGVLPSTITGNRRIFIYPKSNPLAFIILNFTDPATLSKPITQSLPGVVYLGDLNESAVTLPSGFTLRKDLPTGASVINGNPMTIGGTTYARGLATYAGTSVSYNLSGKYARFKADLGIDDLTASSKGSVQFVVKADDIEIYRSATLTGASAAVSLGNGDGLDVTGVNKLTIETISMDATANGTVEGRAEWAGAHLTKAVTGLALAADSARIAVGETAAMGASVASVAGTPSSARSVTYLSSNPAVATVTADGVVTGLTAGTTRITAFTGDGFYSKSTLFRVIPASIASLSFDATSYSLEGGSTKQLNPQVTIAGNYSPSYTWVSSNPAVATVSATGLVTAVSLGTTKITLLDETAGFAAEATVSVTAVNVAAPVINSVSPATSKVVGDSLTLSVSATAPDGGSLSYQWRKNGQPISGATDATFTDDSVVLGDAGTYSVLVTNTRFGSSASTTSANVVVTVLGAALTPALSDHTSVAGGFSFNVTNYDPAYTWTVSTSSGSVTKASPSGSTMLVTVSGLTAGASATVTVRATRTGYVTGTSTMTGDSLMAAFAPFFDTPVKGENKFTVNITNYSSDFDWVVSVSTGTVTKGAISGSTLPLTIEGLTAGQSATVSVTTTRAGYINGTGTISGAAMPISVAPTFGATSSTASGFGFSITNYNPAYTYTVSSDVGTVSKGTASGANLPITVTGLTSGQDATVTVVVSRDGYVGVTRNVTGSAAPAEFIPEVSGTTRTATGFTFSITNYDAAYTWAVTSSAGTVTKAAPSGSIMLVTVSGLAAGTSATVTIKVSRPGYIGGQITVSETSLRPALNPVVTVPVPTQGGFTFTITNYSADYQWSVSGAPLVTIVAGSGTTATVTVSNLSAGQTVNANLMAARDGYVTGSKQIVGLSLKAGLAPTFSVPVAIDGGYMVSVTNFDASYSWNISSSVGLATKGKASGKVLPITVTGLADGAWATLVVATAKAGFLAGTSNLDGISLQSELVATFGAVTPTASGYTISITNYDPAFTYQFAASKGAVTRGSVTDNSLQLTVTGVTAGSASTLTVKTVRAGYITGLAVATGSALKAALVPVIASVSRKGGTLTFSITNYDATYNWQVSSLAGTATLGIPVGKKVVVTVTGLVDRQTTTVSVITSKAGFAGGAKSVIG